MGLWLPDVSQYQGKINWSSIKTPAIVRTGFGDDIKSQDDLYAQYNLKECTRLGIPVATYLYSYADSLTHILSEIEHEKRVTKGYKVLAHILDLEEWRYKDFARQAATRWLSAFPDNGLIYAGQSYWKGPLKGLECKRWIPAYGTNNGKRQDAYKPPFDMVGWQFTSRYHLPGINGNVDMSEWYGFPFTGITPVKITPVRKEVLKKEVAAMIMLHMCAHDAHGYTQDMKGRQGTGTEVIDIYGVKYTIKSGDRDCSSAVISAYEAAGISCGGATYTRNMRERMVKSGNFAWRSMKFTADMGDTYLNEKCHTATCLSAEPDVLMEFSINEKGTALGGKVGDQLQKGEYDETYGRGESHLAAYYDYPWDGILQCVNDEVAFIVEADGSITYPKKEEKNVEVKMPEKTDTDLAVEVLFDVHGSGDKRKESLGSRYDSVQASVREIGANVPAFVSASKTYLKKFGCGKLI